SNLLSKNEDNNQTCKKVIIQYQIFLCKNWKRYVTNYLYLIFSYIVHKNPVLKSMVTVVMRYANGVTFFHTPEN
ncbi:hypothetical protein V1477_001484, partial [Vespula maculifrons]